MNEFSLTINGKTHSTAAAPRTHLADFLRESMHLTGTHLGCEHGICGACTLLLDGEPARSCITFAAACANREVTTIEGLENDPVMAALRTAFSAEHALQCGYCTPGMLITARDIVLRLPDADDDRIRLELAGNLCRCTGYNGIVRAIRRTLDVRPKLVIARSPGSEAGAGYATKQSSPSLSAAKERWSAAPASQARNDGVGGATAMLTPPAAGPNLSQILRFTASRDTLWQALQNPTLVAACVPGAELTAIENNRITGKITIALGPIQGIFFGTADVTYGDFTGTISGEGQDKISKTRLSAQANFTVTEDAAAAILTLAITYSLRGALAQFARPAIVAAFADEVARTTAQNLQARLNGETVMATPQRLSAATLAWRVILRRLKNLFRA
jgi:carbon-monoxide dehydrogenase small subunit